MNANEYITACLNDVKNVFKSSKNVQQKEELYKTINEFMTDVNKIRLDFYTEFSSIFTYCEGCKQWIKTEDFSTERHIDTYENKEVDTLYLICPKCGTKKVIKTNTVIYTTHTCV